MPVIKATLLQQHHQFIEKWKARGGKTLQLTPPCCGVEIEMQAAHEGQTWDSLMTCPHCDTLLFKVATATTISAEVVTREAA